MKLAVYFKKVNRGLIIFAVLLLAFAVFAVADTVSFASQKKVIERTVREYVEKSPQLAILSPLRNIWDKDSIQKTIVEKMEENEFILKKYWSFNTDQWGVNQSEEFLKRVQDVVTYNANNFGDINSAKAIVQSVNSIKKTGYNEAEVTFKYTGFIKYTGDIQWVLFNAPIIDKENNDYLYVGKVQEEIQDKLFKQISPAGEVTAILVKTDGCWKIDRIINVNILLG